MPRATVARASLAKALLCAVCASCVRGILVPPAVGPRASGLDPAPLSARSDRLPGRFFMLDFASPLEGYDANTRFFYSMNQLFGRLNDNAGVLRGMDEELGGRLALTALAFYAAYGMRYYSHEVAHDYGERENGLVDGIPLDLGDWSRWWPEYEVSMPPSAIYWAVMSEAKAFKAYLDGLNQNEFNSRRNWELLGLRSRTDLQCSVAFFMNKLRDLEYIAFSGLDDKRPATPPSSFGDAVSYINTNGLFDDVDDYVICLMVNDVDLSKREYFAQVLLADLLSWHTWESVRAIGRYLRTGERTMRLATWRVSDRLEITPPLISCYITPLGTFYDIAAILNPSGPRPVTVSVGTDVDFIGAGKVARLRLGAQVHGLGRGWFALSPFAYLNSSRADGHEGASIGIEGLFRFHPRMRLRMRLEHNEGDVIENTVKGKEEGLTATFGVDASF